MKLGRCDNFALFRTDGLADRLRPPTADAWANALHRCSVVGRPGDEAPLILDEKGRLYLGRYWHFERILAAALDARSRTRAPDVDRPLLRDGLVRLFPGNDGVDWQRVAAAVAVLRPLSVVSGGPGTGKTRTVTSILALLAEQSGGEPLRLGLAAPTGKAAARLSESIRRAKAELPIAPEIAARIPEEAVTLHRLLGFRPGGANPHHGPDNPLHLDVLVVDEASMVDLPLMARLLGSLPERARLILLGDKDQLSSVEAGMVLGDICGRGREPAYSPDLCAAIMDVAGDRLEPAVEAGPPITDHVVELRKSWRFGEHSGIGDLARAVNRGEADASLRILAAKGYSDVSLEMPSSDVLDDLIARQAIPAHRESRALTRELVYTGITRAMQRVRLFATEERLRGAIARPVDRSTGLYDALRERG